LVRKSNLRGICNDIKKRSKFLFSFLTLLSLNLPVLANAAVSGIDKLMADTAVPFITNNQIPGTAIAIYYNGQDYYFIMGFLIREKIPQSRKTLFLN